MPELPDVAGFKQYIDAAALHQEIDSAEVTDERVLEGVSKRTLQRHLKGAKLAGTRQHGKYLFADLDGDDRTLVLHFGMSGQPIYYKADPADRPEHSRMVLHFTDGYHLAYQCQRMLGEVALADDADAFIGDRGLGPHFTDMSCEQFREAIAGRRGKIKTALMSQGTVAGLGNVYVDETLFQTGIDPRTPARDLGEKQIDELYRNGQRICRLAIKKGDGRELPRSYLIHARVDGAPCPRCSGKVRRIEVSGRGTYICPSCQS